MTEKTYKVLAVDDQGKNLQVVGNILKSSDIQTIFALDGEAALKSAAINRPDLILLDISMPVMDGYEVAENLKANAETSDIPIIFLTARNQSDEIIRGFDLGAVDYITKPFNTKELLRRVRIHLELKHSKDTINQQIEELKILNDTKDKMLSLIAHDLRGPVGNFKTLIELLIAGERDNDEQMKAQILELLQQNAAQTFNLLENLLNWSRSQRGVLSVDPEKFNLNQIILQNIELLKPITDSKKISVTDLTQLELFIYADKEMVNTVIRNILSNALKFTYPNGEISIFGQLGKENFVELTIADNGVGMSDDFVEQLFKHKYTTPSTRGTENEKGSGIGLLLCKEFIEKNQGQIVVESKKGQGTAFTLILPAAQETYM